MKFLRLITRRAAIAAVLSVGALTSTSVAAAEKLKVAAIYTLPVEQQWVSRIHKALNAAQDRGEIEYLYSENVANNDYERVMREYAEQGQQLIVGEVFGLEARGAQGCQRLSRDRVSDGVFVHTRRAKLFGV